MGKAGFEPATSRLSSARSNQLSYSPVFVFMIPAGSSCSLRRRAGGFFAPSGLRSLKRRARPSGRLASGLSARARTCVPGAYQHLCPWECSNTDLVAPRAFPHHRSGMDAPDHPVSTQGALSARAEWPEAKRPDGRARRLREHSPGGAITKPKKGCGVGGSSRPGSSILR